MTRFNFLLVSSQPLGLESRNAPRRDGERCVTPARAAAEESVSRKRLVKVPMKRNFLLAYLKELSK